MEAPDKIYIRIERTYGASDGQVIAMVTPHNERQSVNDIEYIRNDALLEWAKEKKKQLIEQESTNDEPSDVAAGINAGLDMLIGKLNSM